MEWASIIHEYDCGVIQHLSNTAFIKRSSTQFLLMVMVGRENIRKTIY